MHSRQLKTQNPEEITCVVLIFWSYHICLKNCFSIFPFEWIKWMQHKDGLRFTLEASKQLMDTLRQYIT